jgi:predicted nucleic acid-binding protein
VIVADASAIIEFLLRTPAGQRVEERLLRPRESIHAPSLVDVEVAQVLRRYALRGELSATRGAAAVATLAVLPLHRYPHEPLLPRIWELRENLTAYDAAYVALAEALDAPLLTGDERIARAAGVRAKIEHLH